jgi:hypothetical protein
LACLLPPITESARCQLEAGYAAALRQAGAPLRIVPLVLARGFAPHSCDWLEPLLHLGGSHDGGGGGGGSGRGGGYVAELGTVDLDLATQQLRRGKEALQTLTQLDLDELRRYRRADAPGECDSQAWPLFPERH